MEHEAEDLRGGQHFSVLRGDTPPMLSLDSNEDRFNLETPVTLVKSKTSPNPFLKSFSDDEFMLSDGEILNTNSFMTEQNRMCGLCLIIIFGMSEADHAHAKMKSHLVENTFTRLNFNVILLDTAEIINQRSKSSVLRTKSSLDSPPKTILNYIDDSISSSPLHRSLVVFFLGQSVTSKNSRGILSFHEGLDSNSIYSYLSLIHRFSVSDPDQPVLLFFNYISQPNSPPSPEKNTCDNTLFCYSSYIHSSFSPDVNPHQAIISLLESLRETQTNSQLVRLILNTRKRYHQTLKSLNHSSNSNIIFLIKSTLRQSIYLCKNSNSHSDSFPQGLFMVLTNENFAQSSPTFMHELIRNIKKEFELRNFKIAQDILLIGKSSYTQIISKNKSLCQNCTLVFVLIITCDVEPHHISLNDETSLKVSIFSNELANSFPDIPRVLFLSQLLSHGNTDKNLSYRPHATSHPSDYKNMLIVHAVENNLYDDGISLLSNFIQSLQKNYFAEFHSLLQNSIEKSHKSGFIQVIDGLEEKFFFTSSTAISSIVNTKNEEFSKAYTLACLEGSEPFRFYRLMVVGPEGVGKTSLLRYLIGLPFQIHENSTPFINKFDLHVHKISQNWDRIEDLNLYASNLDETREDMAIKYMAQVFLESGRNEISEVFPINDTIPSNFLDLNRVDPSDCTSPVYNLLSQVSSIEGEQSKLDIDSLENKYAYETDSNSPSKDVPLITPKKYIEHTSNRVNSIPIEKIHASLMGDGLSSKSDFLTAWDFAGQDYLYCFHSLFLSPRAIYLLLVDLSVDDLATNIQVRNERMDRHILRSQIGIPTTYLEAIAFWLNAIFSVSKTASTDIYQRPAKILFIFSKCDLVLNPKEIAKRHLETVKNHMNKKNNAFSLVHEDDGLFLISCLPGSPYQSEISKLRDVIKRLSDQIAFQQSIPIKWIELAKKILQEEEAILNHRRIYYLAESCDCVKDVEFFLHLFHDIGFFFYKQGKIINNVQKFLDLIYHIVSPQYGDALVDALPKPDREILRRDFKICQYEAKLSCNLFDCILKSLNLSVLRDQLLDILKVYGILIDSQPEEGHFNYFYVPYLLSKSHAELSFSLPGHNIFSSFFLYFPDGFIPASIYFALLSCCIRRNGEYNLPLPKLGFDCAYFYICRSLLVLIDFPKDKPFIRVIFSKLSVAKEDLCFTDQYVKSEMMDYLIFLQMTIVEIQGDLIPCGNLAKVVLDCTCGNVSDLDQMEHPCICLDQLLLTDSGARESWCYNQHCKIDWNHYFNDSDFLLDYMTKFYDNTSIAKLIFNYQSIFIKYLYPKDISPLLYKFGLATSERIYAINNQTDSRLEKSSSLLEELVHKGPLWAVKFYVALCREYKNPGHQFLRSFIDKSISTGLLKPLTFQNHQQIDLRRYDDRYRMNSNPHGIALLVNIEFFNISHASFRKGSNLDLIALRESFERLHYIVLTKENLTKPEFKKELVRIARLDHSSYDSFFCVVMSHGDQNDNILLSDGRKVSRDEITSEFSCVYCRSLTGKPKIFIIQACRGSKIEKIQINEHEISHHRFSLSEDFDRILKNNELSTSETNESVLGRCKLHPSIQPFQDIANTSNSLDDEPDNLSALSDIFIANSTIQRYSSFRHTSQGSIFIQSFCLVLQYCRYEEFMHIMAEVRRRMSLLSHSYTQCTQDVSHLRKKLYF